MNRIRLNFLNMLSCSLSLLFALDRLAKLAAAAHFFHRPAPTQPETWPGVTLIQPITRGASGLTESLRARARLDYAAPLQHLFVCDSCDLASQGIVQTFMASYLALQAEMVLVDGPGSAVASKIRKLQAALPKANGEVLIFVDDDVAPRPDALRTLIPYLHRIGVGAAFGLPCYTNWRTPWSSMMSGLVNANMLLSFVALTYLTAPFRITGHMVAFRRDAFLKAGGLDGLEQHIDDDFELARRLHAHGLRSVQTPLVYDIDNELLTFADYAAQLRRWFVLPRQAMMPSLSPWQRVVAFLTSAALPLPGIVAILALLSRRRIALFSLGASLGVFGFVYAIGERRYLKGKTPLARWPLLLFVALLTPLQIGRALLSNNEIEWRGQRLRIVRNGTVEVMP